MRPTGFQGSGYYRSATDNYNVFITTKLPFVACSIDGIPDPENAAPLMSALLENCNANGCQDPEDSPECDRLAISSDTNYLVALKAQNYGQGGRPNCGAVLVSDIQLSCILRGYRQGMLTLYHRRKLFHDASRAITKQEAIGELDLIRVALRNIIKYPGRLTVCQILLQSIFSTDKTDNRLSNHWIVWRDRGCAVKVHDR